MSDQHPSPAPEPESAPSSAPTPAPASAPATDAAPTPDAVTAPASSAAPATTPATSADTRLLQRDDPSTWNELEQGIVAALKTVYDPEIPVDIWELGLIYAIRTDPKDGHVDVDMTLTSPMCPVAGTLPPEVQRKISSVPGVMAANVDVIWEPPWSPAMMSEGARLELNIPI